MGTPRRADFWVGSPAQNEQGYTLIEAIVALTIFAIVITTVLLLYGNTYTSYLKEKDKIEVEENLRLAAKKMAAELRQAVEVPVITNNGQKITFKMVNAGGSTDTVSYYYDGAGHEIQKSVNGAGNNPVASYIDTLEFTYNSGEKSIFINMAGSKGKSGSIELSTKVSIRILG